MENNKLRARGLGKLCQFMSVDETNYDELTKKQSKWTHAPETAAQVHGMAVLMIRDKLYNLWSFHDLLASIHSLCQVCGCSFCIRCMVNASISNQSLTSHWRISKTRSILNTRILVLLANKKGAFTFGKMSTMERNKTPSTTFVFNCDLPCQWPLALKCLCSVP